MRRKQRENVATKELEAMINQFHDHIDRAIRSASGGRWDRVSAYLAAARRLLGALPADLVEHFELTGHLAGVTRGLQPEAGTEPLSAA